MGSDVVTRTHCYSWLDIASPRPRATAKPIGPVVTPGEAKPFDVRRPGAEREQSVGDRDATAHRNRDLTLSVSEARQ